MVTLFLAILTTASPTPPREVRSSTPGNPQVSAASSAGDLSQDKHRTEGIWPSEKLIRSVLIRWADDMSDRFELDGESREQIRKLTLDRWGRFLKENREGLQPLLNEMLEMRLAVEPPSPEEVSRWATSAMPMFRRMEVQAREATAEFRDIIPPEQSARFEAEAVQLGLGLQAAAQRLEQWKKGEFEPTEVWSPRRHQRQSRTEERVADEQPEGSSAHAEEGTAKTGSTGEDQPPDQIAEELHRWDKFVRDTIQSYDFDKAQQAAAQSFLSELKGRALAHRDRHKEEIAELERRIHHNPGTDEAVAEIKKDLTELYGPIDEMFKELKARVESLATTDQKIRAAEHNRTTQTRALDKTSPESQD